jgi:tetratricopeptide (TPR) repeat protein
MYLASFGNRYAELLGSADPAKHALLEKNLEWLKTAERLSPSRPQVFFEMGRTFAMLGRHSEQAAAIEKGMALSPHLSEPRFFDAAVKIPNVDLLFAYVAKGDDGAAEKQWRKIKSLSIHLNRDECSRLAMLYRSSRQYEAVIRLYKEQLDQTPNDTQLLAQLAATYRDAGDLEQARQTALRVAALAPDSGPSVQAFLDSLKPPAKPKP